LIERWIIIGEVIECCRTAAATYSSDISNFRVTDAICGTPNSNAITGCAALNCPIEKNFFIVWN
jgi:hypothetical protein